MPRLSDTMTEGRISSWLRHEGDTVARGEVLAEIETDKAIMELESYDSGVLTRILVEEGVTVPIGAPIALIGEEQEAAETSPPTTAPTSEAPTTPPATGEAVGAAPGETRDTPHAGDSPESRIRATPLVRRLAREHGLDLATVTGSGPAGRIVRADIDALMDGRTPQQPAASTPQSPPSRTAPTTTGDVEVAPSNIRRITAERLTASATTPHFHLTVAVDAGPLLALHRQLNEPVFPEETHYSINDLLIRGVALTLARHREINASWGGDKVIRYGQVNVGIAVAVEAGLIVPVLRDADHKSLAEIAAESRDMAERARAGRLTPDELNGGTFTISNLGMFGIEHFTAVINPPQAAILAVGGARDEPVARDGEVTVQPTMRLTMTSDHRLLDGAISAAFLSDLVALLERPLRLLA